jgi:catechol 2,3-dioxygenase-like lactoylglutathione lyase family enzyme
MFRFHHIGMTVANIERTLAFYSKVFGLEPGMTLDITAGPATAEALDLPLHRQRVALITLGDVVMELIEFDPPRRGYDGRQDDVGYAYPCFAVDDIDATYERLVAMGVTINRPPHESHGPDPVTGSKFFIVKDPDGKNIEIVQMGPGMATEKIRALAKARPATFDDPIVLG